MVTILIVVSWHGHHPFWCHQYIQACATFSRRVYVLCPKEAEPLDGIPAGPELVGKVSIIPFSNLAAKTGFKNYADLKEDFRELRGQISSIIQSNPGQPLFIFHTSLDSLFLGFRQLVLLARDIRHWLPWPFAGMLMSPDRNWPLLKARGILVQGGPRAEGSSILMRGWNALMEQALEGLGQFLRWLYLAQRNLVLRRSCCTQIALLDERYALGLKSKTGKQVYDFPEATPVKLPATNPTLAEQISGRRRGRRVVGLLGTLSQRKGLELFLDVVQQDLQERFFYVLAGDCNVETFSATMQARLADAVRGRDNVIFSPLRLASEEDFNAVVQSCDVLYCVYRWHLHSSGLISKAAAFRKPVLVSDGELMAKRIRDYGLGMVLQHQTPEACFALLQEMGSQAYLERFLQTARFDQYLEDHSLKKLEEVLGLMSGATVSTQGVCPQGVAA